MKFVQCADLHIRGEAPICRIDDDWLDAQRKNVRFIVDEANRRKLPLLLLGDIFQTPRTATAAVNMLIRELKRCKYGIKILPGNHDLPQHNYELIQESSLGTILHSFEELKDGEGFTASPFGLDKPSEEPIRFLHRLVFPDEQSRPVEECGQTAQDILDEFPQQKWIFVGDYHHKFHYENEGRHVVNTGCLNIQVSDMADYKPNIAVVDTDAGTVEWVEVPQPSGVVCSDHLVAEKEREERISALIETIENSSGVTLDFVSNLEIALMKKNDPDLLAMILEIREAVKSEK